MQIYEQKQVLEYYHKYRNNFKINALRYWVLWCEKVR
jgi:hypothetical protein